ncbi:hypothetical protein IC235_02825 [Hymenobacter sp. BT664]|uniref:Uncharacterized protein n=1 Tax=Hymenobacter montanus TaxID=2771359 RepID=A0A927GHW0_9BACT|nr:hypothetical protein [Hymenobacter montanus]MBD2766823.1 hypothetical protein [Hymenobacter montanus]
MWTRVLNLIHVDLTISLADQMKAQRLERIYQLLKYAESIQSEPAETAPMLLHTVEQFLQEEQIILGLGNKLKTDAEISVDEWLLLSYLIMLREVLESGWEQFYRIIFSVYPELGQCVEKVRFFLKKLPFSEGLQKLANGWAEPGIDNKYDLAALIYIRSCTLIDIYWQRSVYEKVSNFLDLDKSFLLVFLAAACLKIDGIASKTDISTWSDSQYACMFMMDTFHFLPGTSWG